jgi:hypothetical protein
LPPRIYSLAGSSRPDAFQQWSVTPKGTQRHRTRQIHAPPANPIESAVEFEIPAALKLLDLDFSFERGIPHNPLDCFSRQQRRGHHTLTGFCLLHYQG